MNALGFLYVIIVFVGGLIHVGLMLILWQRRRVTGANQLVWLIASMTFTHFCYLFLAISQDEQTAYMWARMRFVGLHLFIPLYVLFVLEYTHAPTRMVRWARFVGVILFILPQVSLWTNDFHNAFIVSWEAEQHGRLLVETIVYGDLYRFTFILNSTFALFGLGLLIRHAVISRGVQRRHTAYIILCAVPVIVTNQPFSLGLVTGIPNLTPIGGTITLIMLTYGTMRFRLFDLVPVSFAALFQAVDDAYLIFDHQFHLIDLNPAAERLFHLTRAAVGSTAGKVFEQTEALQAFFREPITDAKEVTLTLDGRLYDVRLFSMEQLRRGIPVWAMSLRDISERQQAEQQAIELALEREQRRLLSDFLRNTSHDLRTPLSTINMTLYMLRQQVEPSQHRRVDQLERQIGQFTRTLDQLYQMLSLDDTAHIERESVSLNPILTSIPSHIAKLIESKNLRLTYDLTEPLPPASGDPTLITIALHNILHNAALYTPENGAIMVYSRIDPDQRHVRVIISDTGIGIAPEQLAILFERYTKGNPARTADGSGAGLGLAIAKRVAELHDGAINVESRVNEGSSFCFRLPIHAVEQILSEPKPQPEQVL